MQQTGYHKYNIYNQNFQYQNPGYGPVSRQMAAGPQGPVATVYPSQQQNAMAITGQQQTGNWNIPHHSILNNSAAMTTADKVSEKQKNGNAAQKTQANDNANVQRRQSKSKAQQRLLYEAFAKNDNPSKDEIERLRMACNAAENWTKDLSFAQVYSWFNQKRHYKKNGGTKEGRRCKVISQDKKPED